MKLLTAIVVVATLFALLGPWALAVIFALWFIQACARAEAGASSASRTRVLTNDCEIVIDRARREITVLVDADKVDATIVQRTVCRS